MMKSKYRPVSYTHLDVYKRQVHVFPIGITGLGYGLAFEVDSIGHVQTRVTFVK